jgi:hypothetical protein
VPGGYRLFYTAIGPGKPFAACQGYILSAFSRDGLQFELEPGIRVSPDPTVPHRALRVLAPTIVKCSDTHVKCSDTQWRMYFESRGVAERPTVICSAVSADMLHWTHEEGIRIESVDGMSVGGPRFLLLPDGRGRIYCFVSDALRNENSGQSIMSAVCSDGLNFTWEKGYRLRDKQTEQDSAGITAAEVIPPQVNGDNDRWSMLYSAWQDAPEGTEVPLHPSRDPDAATDADFAAKSIATDIAGYRSRIYMARSPDGLVWERAACAIEGNGYSSDELDAVHSEDMSLIEIEAGQYRMYYAACDRKGNWRIVSAVCRTGTLARP